MQYRKKVAIVFYLLTGYLVIACAQSPKIIADKIVAIVGDRIILYSDINNSAIDLARQGIIEPNAMCRLTEQAIVSKLLLLQAEKDSLPVTDEVIDAVLDQMLRYYINQGENDITGKTIYQLKDEAREPMREKMLGEAMQQKITDGTTITDDEVKVFFDAIPRDSLLYIEAKNEADEIIIYPQASKKAEHHIIEELNNYKSRIENNTVTFCSPDQIAGNADNKDACMLFNINRNENIWDPVFLSAAFRLNDNEISKPVKCKFGIYLIQMVHRTDDKAIVKCIFRLPPVTDSAIREAKAKLDTIRSAVLSGAMNFTNGALKYKYEEIASTAFVHGTEEWSSLIPMDQIDRDLEDTIRNMQVGEISLPGVFTDEHGKIGVRIVYFKSRSNAHTLNLRDDYKRIFSMALEKKKKAVLDKWLKKVTSVYPVLVDTTTIFNCPDMQKYSIAGLNEF